MNNDKNARELLEEALSYISMPVARFGGVQITGWTAGSEIEQNVIDANWIESRVPDWDGEGDIEVIDPEPTTRYEGKLWVMQVCAIGALSLASLTDSKLIRNGRKKNGYTDWNTQMMVNPEVALASVMLAFVVWNRRGVDYYLTDAARQNAFGLGLDRWIELYHEAKVTPNHRFGHDAQVFGNVITSFNDEQVSWEPVAHVFELAIKDLIEKGF